MKKVYFILIVFFLIGFNSIAQEKYYVGDNINLSIRPDTTSGTNPSWLITGIYPNENSYIIELSYQTRMGNYTIYKLNIKKDYCFYFHERFSTEDSYWWYEIFNLRIVEIGMNYITILKESSGKALNTVENTIVEKNSLKIIEDTENY